jgi:hypothetical protein
MYRRFDVNKGRGASTDGKWQKVHRSGVGHIATETDGTWSIEVTMRRVGASIRRDVYSVSIRADAPRHDEFLSGFASKDLALEAAKERVTMLEAVRKRRERRRYIAE